MVLNYDPKSKSNRILDWGKFANTILVYGTAGTGKTATLRAFENHLMGKAKEISKLGLPTHIEYVHLSNDIKSKYFGESVQNLKTRLANAVSGSSIVIVTAEDIDTIFYAREELQDKPAEKDLLNELMNTLEGIATINRGNYLFIATTNRPFSLESALAQRLRKNQVQADGPESAFDYENLFRIMLRQGIQRGYVQLSNEEFAQLGSACCELRQEYKDFTGRPVANVCAPLLQESLKGEQTIESYLLPDKEFDEYIQKKITPITYGMIKEKLDHYIAEGLEQEKMADAERKQLLIRRIVDGVTADKIAATFFDEPKLYELNSSEMAKQLEKRHEGT
jgi:SpoVK/Ycf46/Vps4 family AAA+-type ATPase